MKKLILLIAISLFIFGCNPKMYQGSNDILLNQKEINKDAAHAMKKRFRDSGDIQYKPTKQTFHWDVYEQVIKRHGRNDLFIVPVLYSKEDEAIYRRAWGLGPTDPRGAVAGYSSFILQSGRHSYYYEMATLCPPPETCNE